MNTQIRRTVLIGAFTILCGSAIAQVSPSNIPPPPPVAGPGEMPPPPPGKERGPERGPALRTLTTLSGKVLAYQTNDRYAYNSFTLQNGSHSTIVRFPEHLGKQLMSAAGKGQTVSVKGFTENGPDDSNIFQLVSLAAGSQEIADIPQAAPVVPPVAEPVAFTGSISEFRRDQNGAIRGINLDSKVIIDLPPPAVEQLQSQLKTGERIKVTGFKDTPPAGVVLAAGAPKIVHPQTIEINGQTYLLR